MALMLVAGRAENLVADLAVDLVLLSVVKTEAPWAKT